MATGPAGFAATSSVSRPTIFLNARLKAAS
jgi:hypothetical protein